MANQDHNQNGDERTAVPPSTAHPTSRAGNNAAAARAATAHPSFKSGDIAVTSLATTARATIGAVTTAGRMIKFSVLEIPVAPSNAVAGSLENGHPVAEFVPGLADGETILALASLDGGDSSGVALGTASGIVKRVQPEYPANRDEFELITLKDDDRVVGAAYLPGDTASLETTELVFITTDAQLLKFPASAVRPQGRQAAGMAGIRLSDGASVLWFGAITNAPAETVVVTVAGRSGALPGTGGASVKVTPFAEYPPKGRATGGVRCQRFLKGEDGLILAWIGPTPVIAATESGVMVDLSDMLGRRDGSGTALTRQLARLGQPFRLP